MKPNTILSMLRNLLALLHAAILAHPNPQAVAAALRALGAEAQRVAAKIEANRHNSTI